MKLAQNIALFVGFVLVGQWALFVFHRVSDYFSTEAIEPPVAQRIEAPIQCKKPTAMTLYGNADAVLERSDTVYFYPDGPKDRCLLEVQIVTDSLAGSTNAVVEYQESIKGLIWNIPSSSYNDYRFVVNGSTQQTFQIQQIIAGKLWRVRALASPTTQITRVKFRYAD